MMSILLFFVVWAISTAISRMQLNNMEYRFYNNKVEYTDGFLIKDKKNIQYSKINNYPPLEEVVLAKRP